MDIYERLDDMDSDKAEVKAAELLNGTLHLFNVSRSSDGEDQLKAKSKLEKEGTFFFTEVAVFPPNLETLKNDSTFEKILEYCDFQL